MMVLSDGRIFCRTTGTPAGKIQRVRTEQLMQGRPVLPEKFIGWADGSRPIRNGAASA